jgi:low affinity Fe/Cu permease
MAFAVVLLYAIAWLIFSRQTFGWAAIATLATWMMTLFITRTEHRDTAAIHAKIDELLRSHADARTELITLDTKDVEEIQDRRRESRSLVDARRALPTEPRALTGKARSGTATFVGQGLVQ